MSRLTKITDAWEVDTCEALKLRFHLTSFREMGVFDYPQLPFISIWPSLWSTYPHTREIISVGPQIYHHFDSSSNSSSQAATDLSTTDETAAFLDRCLERNGEHSVIYVCFGSEFLPPPTMSQADLLFDALKESGWNVVYVASGGSKELKDYYGSMPTSANEVLIKRTLDLGEKGHVVHWCDQWNVLAHPVSPSSNSKWITGAAFGPITCGS